MMRTSLPDNDGRRYRSDRRQFSYAFHIPERRLIKERRNDVDRHSPRK